MRFLSKVVKCNYVSPENTSMSKSPSDTASPI